MDGLLKQMIEKPWESNEFLSGIVKLIESH